jgi:acyl carrier protein
MKNTEDQVIDIINVVRKDKGSEIKTNSHLIDDLGFDSLGLLGLTTAIEAEFNISLLDTDFDYENFETVDNVIQLVKRHVKC